MAQSTDFIREELYPRLWDYIDSAFPEMGFIRRGSFWASPKKLDGSPAKEARRDKCIISAKYPGRILENGGESLSLIDFQIRRAGGDFSAALVYLCDIAGIDAPEIDSEEWKAFKERQEALLDIERRARRALFQEEGAAVLSYLAKSRGYSRELVEAMGLGFLSPDLAGELEKLGLLKSASYMAENYPLLFGYFSGSRLLGFKLRAIDGRADKYRNSIGLTKKASFFGLSGLKLTGNGERDRDLTLVEGELDALHAQAAGVKNIAAAAGITKGEGAISEEALLEARRKGVKRVTLLLDSDAAGASAIPGALKRIAAAGLRGLVSVIPEGKDPDEYLNSHSAGELEAVIYSAKPGAIYLFETLTAAAIDKQGGPGEPIIWRDFDDYKEELLSLLNSDIVGPIERDLILSQFESISGVSKEALQETADALRKEADSKRKREELSKLGKELQDLAASGEEEAALNLLEKGKRDFSAIGKAAAFSRLLKTPTKKELKASLKEAPIGIATKYEFSGKQGKERLFIPAGQVTLICGGTSHGKSKLLQNLALQLAQNREPGSVLYFTYEEDEKAVFKQFLNIYVGEDLSKNNLRSISQYYRGERRFIRKEKLSSFSMKEEAFIDSLIASGSLRIYYENYSAGDLLEALRYLSREIKIKAVFIDYIQLLRLYNSKLQRREELELIVENFNDYAAETGLPVIMAAQLSREANSPEELASQNIAEAAGLERFANAVLCIWNSAFLPFKDGLKNYPKSTLCGDLEEKGFRLGTPGKIYAKLTKNRGGEVNLSAVLDFNGNTGEISGNVEEDLPESLFQEEENKNEANIW